MNSPFLQARRDVLRTLSLTATAAIAAVALHAPLAQAQTYPSQPVRIVVGFAPGGTNDIAARELAAKLQERLKQPFVVENKPGANSAIGNDFVAKARPDGYTLLVASSGGLTSNPVLMKNLAYDPQKDFEPIALIGTFPLVVTVNPSLPAKNLTEFIRFAKKDGPLNHGTPTTSFQLVAESLGGDAGIRFQHILYRGSGLVIAALLSNEVHVGILDSPAVMAQVKAGKLKALAVTTAKRSAALPDVPSIAESGFPGFDAPIWTALMAPKGTPEPVLASLRATVGDILKERDIVDKFHSMGMDPGDADAPALAKRISSDIARWTEVARNADMKPQ